ncbi:ATP-binding cassette domain-containing protein [Streptomyces europaeiscabiei]|uniref:ATP-binding cassette domain-containing protein n=2 Tax=Streptomyces europaeiscabiei TaxID=146819 RepID=A0ABU4N9S3_9ACTN|nr:ATP-binding cassette domain-containing protein [Streptomyces europaeiscabiei]MDX2758563.1 ATP-binding cassette domain-containing protein [Streptomyces europaeiscabiei]MDX2768495.1 ATP-binding cassette domain-containing protein [Streptomyces europaeiscabiei]MDX3541794.1 ATP-binding cassette domain-containing protein [Streptomyces europaeiscabiei]MDX3550787.1 ATP-binding cassette domain-containing protein [Streptomyces europaeiscabiei]MDX3665012.1 ATP-binding cassette domain-containing protei
MTNTNGSTADGAPAKDAGDAGDAEQDVVQDAAVPGQDTPIVELRDAGKSYGNIRALHGVNLTVHPGRVTCVLGDNGAGKSTLIKIVSGLHQHTEGEFVIDGRPVRFSTPREALDAGIATVYQDLATVPLMPVWRNFFLGSEMTKGPWPVRRLDIEKMKKTADAELRNMGIVLDDLDQPIGTLSGGQRQCVAIARAVYFGARVLILDEPTAALGVKQSGVVLKYIAAARDRGLGVIFITHNPHHAYMVGDHFSVLRLGTLELSAARDQVSLEELTNHMAGGTELAALKHELAQVRGVDVDELPEAEDLTASVVTSKDGAA